jgi:hypothetical protein
MIKEELSPLTAKKSQRNFKPLVSKKQPLLATYQSTLE